MIVIDVGCAGYGHYDSIGHLIAEFKPREFYGFDPSPTMQEYQGPIESAPNIQWGFPPGMHWHTHAVILRQAAWIYDGEIGFHEEKLGSYVSEQLETKVPCFDLVAFIRSLPSDEEIVLKIDAEGAEYPLLEHLIATRTDELLKLAWIEWHGSSNGTEDQNRESRRQIIERDISCELAEWTL